MATINDENIGLCDECGADETECGKLKSLRSTLLMEGKKVFFRTWLCRDCYSARVD